MALNLPEKRRHIEASPDCRQTKDFLFTPYAQDREGQSGSLLLASGKANPAERYVIKHTYACDPANEFVYYKLAAAIGALMPEIKLFDCLNDMKKTRFAVRHICGSRVIDCQVTKTFSEKLDKALNPQNHFYHCALSTLLDQDDKVQFLLGRDNRLYGYDAAQSFNMEDQTMTAAIGGVLNNPLWGFLFAPTFDRAASVYWSSILTSTSWIEDFRKEHGDGCVPHLLYPFRAFQEISQSYIEDFLKTLNCFYPDNVVDYYRRFIANAQQTAKRTQALYEAEYAELLK